MLVYEQFKDHFFWMGSDAAEAVGILSIPSSFKVTICLYACLPITPLRYFKQI